MEPSEAIKFLQCEMDFAEDDSVGGIKKLMCETAIEACKKQVPMNPESVVVQPYFRKHYGDKYICPVCKKEISLKYKYCPNCGQKISKNR